MTTALDCACVHVGPIYEGNNTMYKGHRIKPNSINLLGTSGKIAKDSTRVRTDGLGTPDFGMPVTIAE